MVLQVVQSLCGADLIISCRLAQERIAIPIGVSIRDLVAIVKVVYKVGSALREHGGAQSHYQRTVQDLEIVQAILCRLEVITSTSGQTAQTSAIRALAQSVTSEVRVFIQSIRKYNGTLGQSASTSARWGVQQKVKWTQRVSKEAAKLRERVDFRLGNIKLLLNVEMQYFSHRTLIEGG